MTEQEAEMALEALRAAPDIKDFEWKDDVLEAYRSWYLGLRQHAIDTLEAGK